MNDASTTPQKKKISVHADNLAMPEIKLRHTAQDDAEEEKDEEEKDGAAILYDGALPEVRMKYHGQQKSHKENS